MAVGAEVAGWKTSRSLRTLGLCSAQKVITLSAKLVFMPQELRDYIVWHELAHLQEFNHSPRFHALCDSYCRGREKALEAQLKRFRAPLL